MKIENTTAANPASVADKVIRSLAEISGTDEVRINLDLALYEKQVFDSMKTVEFILAMEQEFGLYISPAELDREAWSTPRKMIADIEKRLHQ